MSLTEYDLARIRAVIDDALDAANDRAAEQRRVAMELSHQQWEARRLQDTVDRAVRDFRAGEPVYLPQGSPAWPLLREALKREGITKGIQSGAPAARAAGQKLADAALIKQEPDVDEN